MANEPIRVLCVFGRLDRGGAESMCMNLYRHIDREKVLFDFVKHTEDRCAFEDEIEALGGQIYTAPRLSAKSYFAYLRWWKKHLKMHPEHQIIHGHMFTIAPIYFRICHAFGRVTIGHSHSSEPSGEKTSVKAQVKRFLRRSMEKESDYCLACSEAAGMWLFPNKSFTVLKNAIDTQQYSFDPEARAALRREFGIEKDAPVVAVVGSLAEVKNPFGTLSVFHALHHEHPEARLLWCGNGDMRAAVEQKTRELELADAVILAGVRPDIPHVLQAADVYLMPSFYEGLPVSAIEAQAAGLPCVLSDGISRETAITDRCRFVPLNDLDAWVRAIEEGFRRGRSDTTQAIIDAGYDIRTTAAWLQDFYLHILEEPEERRGL